MKRYVRLVSRQLVVGDIVVTQDWREVDVTAGDLARIDACGQVEISATAPTVGVPPIARAILAADLTAAATAGTLDPGAIYFVTDTGELAFAAAADTVTTLAAVESE
ncbi:MAG: hypothetical protein LBF91_01410 [Azoarcus sp.]|jgi:hypothetical protein|nr:hypothetical protein [Azoarcus sp.]